MPRLILTKARRSAKEWLDKKAASIAPESVVKSVYAETEISAGYFFAIGVANLIALCGLLTNSLTVIIGAMLISPLMGPILSTGFAFVTGNRAIGTQALRKIAISVAVTLAIAAIATILSPLKDPTAEILSRTRPNFYDLVIAVLAGSAGAVALCTKKNYLTVVPGVAIATAVIPPLSVAGYGIGIGSARILGGGFLLFFTNFVAILLSTVVVFSVYGFLPTAATEGEVRHLKRRMSGLAAILLVVSIPLAYTLHKTISDVRRQYAVRETLKNGLERRDISRLAGFSVLPASDGAIEIRATVNTVRYLKEAEISAAERDLKKKMSGNVRLFVEQIQVQPGGLKEEVPIAPALSPAPAPPAAPGETLQAARKSATGVIRKATVTMENIIQPSRVAGFSVAFTDGSPGIAVTLSITRDTPATPAEKRLLAGILSDAVGTPLTLDVVTVPVVPPLIFPEGKTDLTVGMRERIRQAAGYAAGLPSPAIRIEASPDSSLSLVKGRAMAGARAGRVAGALVETHGIPKDRISISVGRRKGTGPPFVKVSIIPEEVVPGRPSPGPVGRRDG
ncbi:MAG: TIGR00341 family protein [bacterium]|nr:TIGR00341 family protein [bacterium]